MTFDSSNNLYVSSGFIAGGISFNIYKIDTLGNITKLTSNTNMTLTFNGMFYNNSNNTLYITANNQNIYTVNLSNNSLTILTTVSLPPFSTSASLNGIFGIIIDTNNYLYVVLQFSLVPYYGYVYKINLTDLTTTTFLSSSSARLSYITMDTDNNFYITSSNPQTVLKYNSSGTLLNSTFINSVTFSSILFYNNYLFFTNRNTNSISQYDLNGNVVSNSFATGGRTPTGGGITFDNSGNFYVSNEYNADGTTSIDIVNTAPFCFNKGCKILSLNKKKKEEYKNVEKLKIGNIIKTYKHGYRKIISIHKNIMKNDPTNFKECMYKLPQNTIIDNNTCFEDIIITGGHSILVDKIHDDLIESNERFLGENEKIDDKFLLLSCVSPLFEKKMDTNIYKYYHFVLENDGNNDNRYGVWCNGILTETPSMNFYQKHLQL
jgi:sugar lactone lactonase YvrE